MVEGRMTEPIASRPYMPGYGTLNASHGSGLLPWSWAIERLERSHDYWVATSDAGGRPHVMPVWGAWMDEASGSVRAEHLARPATSFHDLTARSRPTTLTSLSSSKARRRSSTTSARSAPLPTEAIR